MLWLHLPLRLQLILFSATGLSTAVVVMFVSSVSSSSQIRVESSNYTAALLLVCCHGEAQRHWWFVG